MNIAFLTQDEALVQTWLSGKARDEGQIHAFQQPESLAELASDIPFDHIVLSDRYFGLSAFCEYAELLKEKCPGTALTVLLSDRHDVNENGKWIKTCIVNGYRHIPPHRTRETINEALRAGFYGESGAVTNNGGRTIVFVGSTPNIGTTFVSFGAAVGLAARTGRTVAYLCLNLKSSKLHRYMGIEKPEASLDQLRAEIRAGSLRPERLRSYCESVKGVPGLRVLFGNQLREQAEFFTAEDIEHLLHTARRAFDVCIVEVNAYWDNAATVCALLQADSRILVTTPELTHFQEDTERWLRGLCPIIGLTADSFDLVLTRSDKSGSAAGIRERDIRKEMGLALIGKVGRYDDLAETVNQGKLLELLLGVHPLVGDLDAIVSVLAALCGIDTVVGAPVRSWKQRLFGVGAKSGKARRPVWES
ncbi:CpaE family protein [Paenibacillus hodogayensis]|uniref:CpaE family protein n=1 Tax=Paenibacillus hodogayensis TaxID=279208 RepID=A0ABV5VZ88_9BACL